MPIEGMPGWKGYEYREAYFILRDRYTVHPETRKTAGYVEIVYQGVTIWFMAYGGFYKKEAIPCLKAALMATYTKGDFYAGRGRDGYVQYGYLYMIATGNDDRFGFERFFARERVFRSIEKDGVDVPESLGGHEVWGMALI